jgi:N-acetylglucosaminyl-diphospho-decaprenol L-rhamnosyltransferase
LPLHPEINGGPSEPAFSVSIVSHGQGAILADLLKDLSELNWHGGATFELIVTLNIPEDEEWLDVARGMQVTVLRNAAKQGYGTNHNAAFRAARGEFFIVANPDLRLHDLQLEELWREARKSNVGVCGPLVLAPDGGLDDSARRFPTIRRLFLRKLLRQRDPDYSPPSAAVPVDWLAGMFMVFPSAVYRSISGFDERYFMYFEDVEICRLLHRRKFEVVWVGTTAVTHHAARASRRSLRHMRWYAASLLRYLFDRSRR